MKNLHLHNVSIHRFFFYQNQFINEYPRKKKAGVTDLRSHGITKSHRHRITKLRSHGITDFHVLNK